MPCARDHTENPPHGRVKPSLFWTGVMIGHFLLRRRWPKGHKHIHTHGIVESRRKRKNQPKEWRDLECRGSLSVTSSFALFVSTGSNLAILTLMAIVNE